MLSIRLARLGKKNAPSYKVVVLNKRSGRNDRALEILGYFSPGQNPPFKIDRQRADYWLKVGAQYSPAVKKLLQDNKS